MNRKLSSASSQFMSLASKSSYGDDSDLLDLDDDALHIELIDCLKNAAVRILLTLMEFLEHGIYVDNHYHYTHLYIYIHHVENVSISLYIFIFPSFFLHVSIHRIHLY